MLKKIQDFYNKLLSPEAAEEVNHEHQMRLAATALMVEVMRVDDRKTDEEIETVLASVMAKFDIERDEADELLQLATDELHESIDYHQFTSLINRGYGQAERQQIVKLLWQVAYADGELDMYEEHVVRKVSDLLYVSHSDYIRLKEQVRNGTNN